MESSLDISREARLSNSMLKSRPVRANRTRSTERVLSPDPQTTPHEASGSDAQTVVFRQKKSSPNNRSHLVTCVSLDDGDDSDDGSDFFSAFGSTLFYVTSSNFDDTPAKPSSLSPRPAPPPPPPPYENSSIRKSFGGNSVLFSSSPGESQYKSLPVEVENAKQQKPVESDRDSIQADLIDEVKRNLKTIRENPSANRCADCDADQPSIAIVSWLLIICKRCAAVHRQLTSDFLHFQPLKIIAEDSDRVELFRDLGNHFSNSLLENSNTKSIKPKETSSAEERSVYIEKKYVKKCFVPWSKTNLNIEQLNQQLYATAETPDCPTALRLLIQGADPNYSQKVFPVADHAKRHQQMKQSKLILANGGFSEFDLMKTDTSDSHAAPAYLSTNRGVLKNFVTRYENDHLKIYSISSDPTKAQQSISEIDLNRVLAIYNQSVNAIPLKCRLNHASGVQKSSQCTLIVDGTTTSNEYAWVFPDELDRSVWIRELVRRRYAYHEVIYPDFILLTQINLQEGINSEKQQVTAIVYPGRLVLCTDTMFDEIDLRKYSSLSLQRSDEFHGVLLCFVNQRYLYLSSPISKLHDRLYASIRQATKVKNLTDLNGQILTSQNIPVIVDRFLNFIFEHGLTSKGIYRQSGSETKIKQLLIECLEDPFTSSLTHDNYSEHDVASALKRFLRQLDIPLLGTRQNYKALLRSTVDAQLTEDDVVSFYRAVLKDLKQQHPVHYATLRTMLMHIHSVAMLEDMNGMSLRNLIAIFTPCFISNSTATSINWNSQRDRKESNENELADDSASSSPPAVPLSSSYVHVTPSIEADLKIMQTLCQYYRPLFDISDVELTHERTCVAMLLNLRDNPSFTRKLEGTLISVYFESRADELNGYAINVIENETTADMVIEKLLGQVKKSDCFFWALFEVIIDQNLERPMYCCESISEVLDRYGKYLSHELNLQATFVLKLNYVQFERERLLQKGTTIAHPSIQCEYFDVIHQRWMPCLWRFERANLQVHRVSATNNDRMLRRRSSLPTHHQQELSLMNPTDASSLSTMYSWSVDEIYLYIGADARLIEPFDMNEYRVLTILPTNWEESSSDETPFGIAFRFADRHQMFAWYLELVHVNGHDKWTRPVARTLPDGVSYLPLQNYHTASNTLRKRAELSKNKFIEKSRHVASNLYKQFRK